MFAVDDILISDAVLDAPFTCVLGACHGACCVQGDAGAPLRADEIPALEAALPDVRDDLRPDAQAVIEEQGVWERTPYDEHAAPCTDDGACVFATFDGPVATCALHRAHQDGRTDFVKPLSCHLFPLRIEQVGPHEVLNVQHLSICAPARAEGRRTGVQLADLLREPLIRAYDRDWYTAFHAAWTARRQADSSSSRAPEPPC